MKQFWARCILFLNEFLANRFCSTLNVRFNLFQLCNYTISITTTTRDVSLIFFTLWPFGLIASLTAEQVAWSRFLFWRYRQQYKPVVIFVGCKQSSVKSTSVSAFSFIAWNERRIKLTGLWSLLSVEKEALCDLSGLRHWLHAWSTKLSP